MIGNETRWLRRWPVVCAVAALACVAGPSENDAVAGERITLAPGHATVVGLRQAGWMVTEQQERIERRPGLPPRTCQALEKFGCSTAGLLPLGRACWRCVHGS